MSSIGKAWLGTIGVLVGLAVGVRMWTRAPAGTAPRSPLNLLIITLDTTRADAMGAYGGRTAVTPAFDRVAADGVLFEQAISAAPLTLPAHTSLFTGKFPPGHGVRDNGGFFLKPDETTLAERLKANGFTTGGFVGAYVLDRRWGIGQGFDTYFDEFDTTRATATALASVERPGNEVADRALAWLGQASSSRFFAWVHFYDAHSPYDPPEPYRTQFSNAPYLGEVSFVDSQVRRLIDFLQAHDLLRRTIVVIMGDHGESLGEHLESTHGFFVYQSVVRVPLAVLAPIDTLGHRRVAATVRSVDVMPTVLELLGLPSAGPSDRPDRIDGRSLVPLMSGASRDLDLDAYSEAMYPRYHFGWSELRSLTAGRYKFIDAPRPELYDLDGDPSEAHNLYDSRRALADGMQQSLRARAHDEDAAAKPKADVDPEARARLAALGYVGTFAAEPRQASTLADPKDKIEIFNLMTDAREHLQSDSERANGLEMLERVTRKDPQVVDAWLLLANEQATRRDYERALANYRRALELKPDYDLALRNMANVYRDMGRIDDAVAGFNRRLTIDPDNAPARQELAQMLLDADRVDEAERELKDALTRDPDLAAAHNTLGAIELRRGHIDAGEREIRSALARRPDLPLAHFNLAVAAEQRHDLDTAIAEYRLEIERHPGSYRAQFNLGKIYEQRGDHDAQRQAFEAAIASNPSFAEGHLFLAKLYLDARDLDRAADQARAGLKIAPTGTWSPLGHFVLSDVYAAQSRPADAAREVAEARRLAARSKR